MDGLEGLTGRGLFISDIPIHDATRDVILVGEQARAQVRLNSILDSQSTLIKAVNPPPSFGMCNFNLKP